MIISNELAQDIVTNINEILKQEINYIDTNGIIIASTDLNRIGSQHEGAKQVFETRKELIIDQDNQWIGARKGINFPVFFNQEVVGIIGITGDKNDVLQYGKILQKMTEILVKDAYIKDLQNHQKQNQKVMIERILNHSQDENSHDTITNFIEHEHRKIIIGKCLVYFNADQENRIHMSLNSLPFNKAVELFTITGDLIILFVLQSEMRTDVTQQLFDSLEGIVQQKIFWGIGSSANSFKELQESYHHAQRASVWAENILHKQVCKYEEMELGILLSELPVKYGHYYIEHIFKSMTVEQLSEIEALLTTYESFNGSISKSADALFIHKNTLQYQLLKIKKDTGYDPRNLHDFLILKTALLLHKLYKT